MNIVSRFLKLIGLIETPYTEDEILNAENENDMHDHSRAFEAARCAVADREESSQKLRNAIEEYKIRIKDFTTFEQELRMEKEHVRRNRRDNRVDDRMAQ